MNSIKELRKNLLHQIRKMDEFSRKLCENCDKIGYGDNANYDDELNGQIIKISKLLDITCCGECWLYFLEEDMINLNTGKDRERYKDLYCVACVEILRKRQNGNIRRTKEDKQELL